MVLEPKYFHGIGAFEVCLSKVSALKFSHPSVYPVLCTSQSLEVEGGACPELVEGWWG